MNRSTTSEPPVGASLEAADKGLQATWVPGVNPWIIATSVMLATFMVALDSSVVNVALPHIAGNLSVSTVSPAFR